MNQTTAPNRSHVEAEYSSDEELFPYSSLTFSCAVLVSCVFGTFGNSLSFLIYNSRSMRGRSINSLLAGLSAVDFVLTILAIPVFVLPGFNFYLHSPILSRFYVAVPCALYQVVLITQSCSVWTVVLISIERYVAVVHPLKVRLVLTVNRARCAQCAVILMAVMYNCVRFFEYEPDGESGGARKLLLKSRTYFLLYYVCFYLLTHCFGPFVVIFVLNVLILRTIRRSGALKRSKEGSSVRRSNKQKQQGKITRMIVVVTSVFAICNTLPYVINIWEAAKPDLFESEDPTRFLASFLLDTSNALIVINSSTTCLVYLCYCRKYKIMFLNYCMTMIRCGHSASSYSRSFPSFDSYFSNADFTPSVFGGSSIGCKSVRSHSDTLAMCPDSRGQRRTSGRDQYKNRKTGMESDKRPCVRHSLQVPTLVQGRPSLLAHVLFNGSIRAAIFASRKSV